MDLFRVRLNCIDHYQATPTRYDPQLRNDIPAAKGPKVPVIRVFGSTETGQKVCAHIHGAFPYLYVDYEGSLEPDEVGAYIYRLHLSIDHALAVSYRRDQFSQNASYVARVTLVKGVPFYGFHVGYRFFLKIYMFNPIVMTRLADLLQQGVIMKRKFQPYEAHLQYLLQFMVDYNLYGCDYLDSSVAKFRAPVPERNEGTNSSHLWHSMSIPPDAITKDTELPRLSHCSIEVDLCVQNITNRKTVKERLLHHDFIERVLPLPGDMKLVHSMAGLWKDETKRRKRQMKLTKHGSSPFPPEVLVSMSADPRDTEAQQWIHEEEYREDIRQLVAQEKNELGEKVVTFENFAGQAPLENTVNTALQSVEDLFPAKLMPALGLLSLSQDASADPQGSIEVDDEKVGKVKEDDEDFFPSDSDEEALGKLAEVQHVRSQQSASSQARSLARGEGAVPPNRAHSTENLLGICTSGLKSGAVPHLPLYQDLLNIAEDEGIVGRANKRRGKSQARPAALKRTASSSFAHQIPMKKHKFGELPTEPALTPWVPMASQQVSGSSAPKPSSQSKKSPLSPTRQRFRDRRLSYPVVKTQDGSGSKPRASQKSVLSSSQISSNSSPTKRISFDPSSSASSKEQILSLPPDQLSAFASSSSKSGELAPQLEAIQQALACHTVKPTLMYGRLPPSVAEASFKGQGHDVPHVVYQDAYYGKEKDVPPRLREYAGKEFRLQSNTLPFLPVFDPSGTSPGLHGVRKGAYDKKKFDDELARVRRECKLKSWEFGRPPPSYGEVEAWTVEKAVRAAARKKRPQEVIQTQGPKKFLSQIDGPTPMNKHGFKYSQRNKSTSVEHEAQYMSTMSLEIHVNTRGNFVPNPEEDAVQCVFWTAKSDEAALSSQNPEDAEQSGIVVLCADSVLAKQARSIAGVQVVEESTELALMVRMVEIVRTHDPDVLTGYEVHGGSWGYLIERARLKYDYNLCDEFSRMKAASHGRFGRENDRWGFNTTSTIRVTGRHMINIWRAMRSELNLLQYTMENVAWHLLHRRIPHYPWKTLTAWYQSGKMHELTRLLKYYQIRTRLDIQILESNELVPRTSEQARLLGVDFFSVFSRGSQFKVESIMFRIAKPENLILVSPSRKQVGGQNALECLPLVMEPQSAFYSSPMLVLDFQSLYPSVMIAYNLCYSTFLGRITNWRGMNKMGFTEYKRQAGLLALLKDYINITPNGMMYVKAEIRKSLLAKMLTEILETRVMVKSGMKQDKDDKTLQQLLNNRQLALKLLANVTYGYASASFSGRMPCAEIADSIVQTGRETLERAIAYIHSVERWGAEVVYGDTDSLFIYLKGRTRDEAFDIGNEIAKAITDQNPRPVKLKFEKVYHPCVLLAKKRYVGYKYESKVQVNPEFDAKGIETVRRDGTPAEQKIEEKALKILFETADLSQIKSYFQSQCAKIMRGNVSVQDFCFAKEVRLGTYSEKGLPPAGALISTKRMLQDARAEPQYGERVPYVVISGAPGARLIDRCIAPEELLDNPQWTLDAEYYISKNLIPPLERIFNLVGANVRGWYDEMPKVQRIYNHHSGTLGASKRTTIESYLRSTHCLLCKRKFTAQRAAPRSIASALSALCPRCRGSAGVSLYRLTNRLVAEEKKYKDMVSLCQSCSGLAPLEDIKCDSKDCPVFWTRTKQGGKVRGERGLVRPVIEALEEVERKKLEW